MAASRRPQPRLLPHLLQLLLLLLLQLSGWSRVAANPLKDPKICGRPTCVEGSKFKYLPNMRYNYTYTAQVATLFQGASHNESTLDIDAAVSLEFVSACEAVLKVENVAVWEGALVDGVQQSAGPVSERFGEDVSENPLRFAFSDGVITELCPTEDEPGWVLNFKRGILSAFQNTMRRFDVSHSGEERDVHGDCKAHYSLERAEGTSLIISKRKDFASCSRRNKFHSAVQTTPYVFHSRQHGVPLVRSRGSCNLTVDHHVYKRVECAELHVFQPFSHGDSGAVTRVRQTLTLDEEVAEQLDELGPVERRAALLFDHDLTPKPTTGELRASRELLKRMCHFSDADVQPQYPDAFSQFLRTARELSYSGLVQLYMRAPAICPSARHHLLTALPLLGSNAAINAMRDFILRGLAPEHTARDWLFTLAFLPRPDLQTVALVTPLLRNASAPAEAVLSVSAVLHTYCRAQPHCARQPPVRDALLHLEGQLRGALDSGDWARPKLERAAVAVKALANIGEATAELQETLRRCVAGDRGPLELRVACIEAHRRLPCDTARPHFLDWYRNQTAEPELRIAAYLQVMRCPDYNVIKTIQHTLREENVNQVGSFVWTHLHNLLKSSIPSRVELQGLLQQRDLDRKFSSDARKFSHNFQGSVFFEEYNAGGNYESNLIFSPKSYIPRSAMLNLTVDLFGESINLLELSGRMEGFEHYIESLFGPRGPLSSSQVNSQLERVLQRVRIARQAEAPDGGLADAVGQLPNVIDNNFDHPKVSLGLKVFGNELRYHTLDGDAEVQHALHSVNPVRKLQQLLSGQEISFKRATKFLDADYVVPTGAGLPMSLNALGTAAVSLQLSGSLEAPNFLQTGVLDLKGTVRPSVAINVVGSMAVDAYYASAGIRLKTNLYTSSAVDGQLKVRGRRLVSLTFNLPKDKTELITAESELAVLRGGEELPQRGIEQGRVEKRACSWPALDQTLGLSFCADIQFPNATRLAHAPAYVFNGPTKLGLAIQKADATAKKFLLEYKWETTPRNSSRISLVFDTPGSASKREVSARLHLDSNRHNLTLLVQSAKVKYEALGRYTNTEGETSVHLELDVSGRKHVDMEVSLRTERITNGLNYAPRLFLAINGTRIAELSGTLRLIEKGGVSQCDVNLEFKTRKLETKLKGYVERKETRLATNMRLDYQFQNANVETVTLKALFSNRHAKALTRSQGTLQIESSAYPQYNFNSSFHYTSTPGHFDLTFDINYGLKWNDPRNKLTLSVDFTFSRSYDTTKINLATRVNKPISDINLKFTVSYVASGADTHVKSIVRYATGKEIHVTLDLKIPRSTLAYIESKLNVTLPSFEPMVLDFKLHEKKPKEYSIDLAATWFSGHSLTVKGLYQDRSTHKASNHHLKLLLRSPSFEEIAASYKYLRDETELRVELQADHSKDKYYMVMRHSNPEPSEYESYVELRVKSNVYSLLGMVSLEPHRQIVVQLHLDRIRDIHLLLKSVSQPQRKGAIVEVKWDANRDPTQKVAAELEYLHPEAYNHSGMAMLSYPGRAIRATGLFALKESRCDSAARFEWSPTDAVDVTVGAVYQYEDTLVLGLNSELLTPFDNWKKTSLAAGIRHHNNLAQANASVHWHDDQHVALNLFGDYDLTEHAFRCELNASILSTVAQVSSMSGSFSHRQSNNVYDTLIHLQNYPQKAVSVKSTWRLDESEDSTNLTGSVALQSPYPGYQDGVMLCRMHLSSDWDVKGAAELTLDRRKYSFGINGYVKKLTDNMLVFNLTTPIENYSKITGRFGYSGEKKHLVAEIKSPSGAIGGEILFQFHNTNNFNVKFNLATPIEFLQRALLVAKLEDQTVDFRCGWNKLVIGFFGQWHYASPTDFEYCYKIYTPLEGFYENGVIAKVIKNDGLDFAVGLNLGDSKLGLKVQGAPKPLVPADLKIARKQLERSEHQSESEESMHEVAGEEEEDDDEELISWKGLIEVDTYFHPTLKGTLEIDEKDDTYIIESSLTLPNGTAFLYDEFEFPDMLSVTNKFQLITPFPQLTELRSDFIFKIDLGVQYVTSLDVSLKKHGRWVQGGALLNYTYEEGEDNDLHIRSACVKIFTPFEGLKYYLVQGALETEDNTYRMNVTLATTDSHLTSSGYLQVEEGYIESSASFLMNSPVYSIPSFRVSGKRDITQPIKRIELILERMDTQQQIYKLDGHWNFDSHQNFQIGIKIDTPYETVPSSAVGLAYLRIPENGFTSLYVLLSPLPEHSVQVNSTLSGNDIAIHLQTPLEHYRNVTLSGTIQTAEEGLYTVQATLKCDMKTYNLDGSYLSNRETPFKVEAKMVELEGEGLLFIHANIIPIQHGYNMSCGMTNKHDNFDLQGSLRVRQLLDSSLSLKATSTHPTYRLISFSGNIHQQNNGNITVGFNADTSLPGYERVRYTGNAILQNHSGEVKSSFETAHMSTSLNTLWTFKLLENMMLSVNGHFQDDKISRYGAAKGFFYFTRATKKNPKKNLQLGVDVNLDRDTWQFGSNATVSFSSTEDIDVQVHLKLPPPRHDIHSFHGKMKFTQKLEYIDILAKYSSLYSQKNYGVLGQLRSSPQNPGNTNGYLKVEYGHGHNYTIDNTLTIVSDNVTTDLIYILNTPYHNDETFKAFARYDKLQNCNKLRAQLFSPGNQNITQISVDFTDFANMNGTLVSATPFPALSYAGMNFKTSTYNLYYKRFAEVFWPNNTAIFNSEYTYERLTTNFNGWLLVEIPLATRHTGKINYSYKEEPLRKTGYAKIQYNNKQFLEGNYRCDSESSAGHEKDKIKIELENEYFPLGIVYTHEFRYSGGHSGSNLPTVDVKHAEIFKLHNKTAFHLNGELNVHTTDTGQEITMIAKHLKRIVRLKTDYDQFDHEFRHKSTLILDSTSWASYDITIVNKTTENKDEEHVVLKFAYPERNFTILGYYQLADNSLYSELNFEWNKDKTRSRSVGTSMDWKRLSFRPNKQHVIFSIKHPSFVRNITFDGKYYSDEKNLMNISMDLVYSNDTRQQLSLFGNLQDVSQGRNRNYQYHILGTHPATRLDLKVKGDIYLERGFYKTNNIGSYMRSYLPNQTGELNGKIDTRQKEIDLEKKTQSRSSHLKGKFAGKYPLYRVDGAVLRGDELNSTGALYLNVKEKILFTSVNTTEDDVERSFYMDGNIPDSRNAIFNVWTDYEDSRIMDVIFYLRLNHSRLVTSKLRWRPELENEIKTRIDEFGSEVWNGFFDTADYWKKYIRSETYEAVQDIWDDAEPLIQEFLDDVEELKSLREDFESFKIYLNDSYNNNDFYTQDIVVFCNKLMDDLSIREHIQSLPAFVKEIWEIMGESSEAILKSIRWIIDTIKSSYQKAVEFINSLMRGDLTSKISELLTQLVEKYEKMVKDLHVAFVKYMADLWNKASTTLSQYWDNFVLTVEPTFVMIAHYVETIVWNVSNEVLDFLYQRKTELVESPYFSKVANFTQDLDKFYKDLMKNDIITNIRKYSTIIYEFIRDKYFAMVPFGKELQDVANEIITELQVLQKLPSIKYTIEKFNEFSEKVVWVYNYLDLGTRVQNAVTLIHLKITDITQTALQAENRYREAKTLFIFDPENGYVMLEQKLPMSWHAFDETPRFEEIPEYKAIGDLQSYFVTSNITFWTIYYEYKPYTEPSNWLPPFSGQAIIAGYQHFMTFDRSFYEFQGSCSYLLASDFVDRNFSMVITYNMKKGEHILSIIVDKQIIHIDIFNDAVTLDKGSIRILPLQIGDTYVYQEASIVTVESERGFHIRCNLKFDICVIGLSGWYYGKTAGLLGTMDNEPTTDFLTSKNVIEHDLSRFAHTWSVNRENCLSTKNYAVVKPAIDPDVLHKCREFFVTPSSQFSSCFSRVDSTPFLNMCLNSRNSTHKEPCSIAVAYMQACLIENTPLRIPEYCVKCHHLVLDVEVPEGDFRQLEGDNIPHSTDVVFIVEAGGCNANITSTRSLEILIPSITKELTAAAYTDNRYAVVVFGGSGVYDQPRSITINNNVFATFQQIMQYFEKIPTGDGNKDIFGAIRFATQLLFRPAVSKTFILLPCSSCDPHNMTLDYSVLHQVLLENGIKLHILMNDEFTYERPKIQKMLYGMDREAAYTNKDAKDIRGDTDLRRQVRLPKSKLGFCTALAMETNGTVFTAKRLQAKKNIVKKFATVFAKRVAMTADPYSCQKCECTADNNGMSYIECFPCEYPQPSHYSYDFDEELDMTANLDQEDIDYIDEDGYE